MGRERIEPARVGERETGYDEDQLAWEERIGRHSVMRRKGRLRGSIERKKSRKAGPETKKGVGENGWMEWMWWIDWM
jgi:hypothetical protein